MNFKLEKEEELSGKKASIYVVIPENEDSLLDQFFIRYEDSFEGELKEIYYRLNAIGHEVGARENFFKHQEGLPGDLVCALYDDEERNLRLYCMRMGKTTIILGGGGYKSVRAWQEDEVLKKNVEIMIEVSRKIFKRMKDKEIKLNSFDNDLSGDLEFYED